MVLTTGTALSQLIPFIVLPILQKYFYGPSDFALLATFVYFSEMLGVVSTLKLEYAIVAQRSPQEAREVAVSSLRIAALTTLLSFVAAFVFYRWDIIHGLHQLGMGIFLLPPVVFAIGAVQVTTYWFNVRNEFNKIAQGKLLQTSAGEGVKLFSGYAGLSYLGLISGRVLGYWTVAALQLRRFISQSSTIERRHFSVWDVIRRHRSYVLFTTPSVFVGALINFMYIELFLENFGPESAGMVSVAMTYVGAGLGMVAGSISHVFYSTVARMHLRSEIQSLYMRFIVRLMLMSVAMMGMIWIFPAAWIVGVLGPEWNDLILYCRVISIWLGVWFISSSLSFIYIRLQCQREMLVFDLFHIAVVYLGFHFGKRIGGDEMGALWGFTFAQVLAYAVAIVMAIVLIRRSKLLLDR